MSGSPYSDWALPVTSLKQTLDIAQSVGCSSKTGVKNINLKALTKCLRTVNVKDLMAVTLDSDGRELHFGPIADGVIISRQYLEDADHVRHKLSQHKIIFGVTSDESVNMFSEDKLESGFTEEFRDSQIWTFVKSKYKYHQREIFASIISEYTDWDKPHYHPINVRDATIDAFTDARYVAPILQLARFIPPGKTGYYFYVFDYMPRGRVPQVSIHLD